MPAQAEAQLNQYNQPTGLRSLPLNDYDVSLVLSAAQCFSWQQNAMLLALQKKANKTESLKNCTSADDGEVSTQRLNDRHSLT